MIKYVISVKSDVSTHMTEKDRLPHMLRTSQERASIESARQMHEDTWSLRGVSQYRGGNTPCADSRAAAAMVRLTRASTRGSAGLIMLGCRKPKPEGPITKLSLPVSAPCLCTVTAMTRF